MRKLFIALDKDMYRTLQQLAATDDRAPEQEARFLLRKAIERAVGEEVPRRSE